MNKSSYLTDSPQSRHMIASDSLQEVLFVILCAMLSIKELHFAVIVDS